MRRDGERLVETFSAIRDRAFADKRDGHRVGAHAVACDAAGGVGGVEEGWELSMTLTFPI